MGFCCSRIVREMERTQMRFILHIKLTFHPRRSGLFKATWGCVVGLALQRDLVLHQTVGEAAKEMLTTI